MPGDESEPDSIDWSNYAIDVDGIYLSHEGFYKCEADDSVLRSTGGLDRSGAVPEHQWQCPECGERWWVSLRGPTRE